MTEPSNSADLWSRIEPAHWRGVIRDLRLSPQQSRIVALMLQGKKDKQIAAAMGLRVATVRTYLSRLFQRTGAGDRVELLIRVFASMYARASGQKRH